jgi:hypothetical protein
MRKQLAKVKSATLSIKDRGILTFWISVNYEEGCSQGVGGVCLDTYDKHKKCRIGTAGGLEIIRQILLAFNIDDLHQLKDRHLWVLGEGEGFSFTPKGVQPLRTDNFKAKPIIWDDIFMWVGTDK